VQSALAFNDLMNSILTRKGSKYFTVPPEKNTEDIKKLFLQRAFEAAKAGIRHPELVTIKELGLKENTCSFLRWTMIAETISKDSLFCEAVISHKIGVLFLTFETPHSTDNLSLFRSILKSVFEINDKEMI
jgi:hypothetical protein